MEKRKRYVDIYRQKENVKDIHILIYRYVRKRKRESEERINISYH